MHLFLSFLLLLAVHDVMCMEKNSVYGTFCKQDTIISVLKQPCEDVQNFLNIIRETSKTAQELIAEYDFPPHLIEKYILEKEFKSQAGYTNMGHLELIALCATNRPEAYKRLVVEIITQEMRIKMKKESIIDHLAFAREECFNITEKGALYYSRNSSGCYMITALAGLIPAIVSCSLFLSSLLICHVI